MAAAAPSLTPGDVELLPSASSLARALLTLSRSGASGVLDVHGESALESARISVVDGTPRAISLGFDARDSIGDLLAMEGSLDVERHAMALTQGAPSSTVGEWLVRSGATTRPALSHALRRQLRGRVRRIFEWTSVDLHFVEGSADVSLPLLEEPIGAADLVLGGLRAVLERSPAAEVRRSLGEGVLKLTPLGEILVKEAALWPDEAAMIDFLRRGARAEDLTSLAGGSVRALRGLLALKLAGAAGKPRAGKSSYRTLLRKSRQLKRTRDPGALLDLPRGSRPEQARRALRNLARELHPDRFAEAGDPVIGRASNDVLTALVQAEADILERRRADR